MKTDLTQGIYWILKDKYAGKWRPEILRDIRRLKAGEPVDYIIGWAPFLNCKIDLSFKPLIPRPETEYWTEHFIETMNRSATVRCLDIFAGSGCIGVAILKNCMRKTPGRIKVDFAEINPEFLKQIKLNLKLNSIPSQRYRIIHSNVLKNIRMKYDYILANPPYVAIKDKNKVQRPVLKYEPRSAIFGGQNGLLYIKRFLKEAYRYLKSAGEIWIEFNPPQKKSITKFLRTPTICYGKWTFYRDQYKKWRYIKIKK